MKRKIAAIGLLLLMLSCLSFFVRANADEAATYNAEEMYERAQSAVFYLRALNGDNTLKASGTGVMISTDGIAATAYHVIAEADHLEAVFGDGRKVSSIEVLGVDDQTDAAVLKLPAAVGEHASHEGKASYNALRVRGTAVKHGEKVFAIGYPMKDTPIITEGIINSPKAEINGRDRILTSAQIASGMSGGPVIDRYGRLAGIVSGSMRTMNNIHLVIPMEQLRMLLPASTK
ncbi:S1 family peptidase [Paenibacillus planticolens]|uniref:Trypsin-like serine protease n=1 Tax=Paenibacillus planticolens TaxID=2654976 RepID=A0ABX1ZLQ5_9BACL|nr:serine protease [Paenibacillus planticolens]NOU99811.1 trypsin-like serine protease [Paenibacillus planticolens]